MKVREKSVSGLGGGGRGMDRNERGGDQPKPHLYENIIWKLVISNLLASLKREKKRKERRPGRWLSL